MAEVNHHCPVPPAVPEAAKPFFDELAALLAARFISEKKQKAAQAKTGGGA